MSKAVDLLKLAKAKREEARSRRSLARLAATANPQRQLERQAHELEAEARGLEDKARRARRPGASTE